MRYLCSVQNQLLTLTACMILCYAVWGFFFMYLRHKGVDFIRHFWLTTIYFLCAGVFAGLVFWSELGPYVLQGSSPSALLVLGVFFILQAVWSITLPHFLRQPADYFKRYPDRYYLQVSWRRTISKSADIAAQQVFIVLMVLMLRGFGLPLYQLLIWFFVLFAFLHLPLIMRERGRWPSLLFGGAIVAFSAVFPLLILYVPYGFIYTFILHWLFYMGTATTFWYVQDVDMKIG